MVLSTAAALLVCWVLRCVPTTTTSPPFFEEGDGEGDGRLCG